MEIRGSKVYQTWKKSVKKLINSTDIVPTERNGDTIELNNMVLIVSKPLSGLEDIRTFDKGRGNDYDQTERINYWEAVNTRLRAFGVSNSGSIDQISSITSRLSANAFNRQGYATIWSPEADSNGKYPCCIVGIYCCIRENRLNMTAILRSNDAWGQALDDMYHLIIIQQGLAKALSPPVGTYTHFAMSYHIYMSDLIKARILLQG